MGKTQVKGSQIKNATIAGEDLNTTGSFQVGTLAVGSTADSSAALTVTSTSKGILLPRMTSTQRDAISSPTAGLVIYDSTNGEVNFYNGSAWRKFSDASATAAPSGGAFTIALFDGGTTYRTGYHASSITSISDADGDDIKFKVVYASTTLDNTGQSQSSTVAAGGQNSKKYSAVKFGAQDSGAVSLVQLVVTAVASSTTVKVKIYSSTGFGGSSAPDSLQGSASDAASISGAGTISFTWSSGAPSVSAGNSYWIVFEDQD